MAKCFHIRQAASLLALVLSTSVLASSDLFLEVQDASPDLLQQVESSMGASVRRRLEERWAGAESTLEHYYQALPKNSQRLLPAPVLRYALHRNLLQRRGWRLAGLDPRGDGWSSGSPTVALKDAPQAVSQAFETHLSRRGLTLKESALFLALLEILVESDSIQRISKAYYAAGVSTEARATYEEVHWALETYLRSATLGPRDSRLMSPRIVQKLWSYNMTQQYPGWPQALAWLNSIEEETLAKSLRDSGADESEGGDGGENELKSHSYAFSAVTAIAKEVSSRYGLWQNEECKTLKSLLLALEDSDCPGHVSLANFYDSALHRGRWQFTENIKYLNESGSLDWTDKNYPSVFIPNYMTSLTNCLASSNLISTCCMDECEPVLQQFEAKLPTPSTPKQVLEVASTISTSTQPARSEFSEELVQHLHQIAAAHGGVVPLQGRLFAQWLNKVFPRECSYPHEAHTMKPRTHLEWRLETGSTPEASKTDMSFFTSTHPLARTGGKTEVEVRQLAAHPEDRQCSSWSQVEEDILPAAQGRMLLERVTSDVGNLYYFAIPALALTAMSFLGMNKAWRSSSQPDFRM